MRLRVNGKDLSVDGIEPSTPLLWVLRDHLNLTGTKYGCGRAECGSCMVHLDGAAFRSCVLPLESVGEREVTTIEGLSQNGDHSLQKAWSHLQVAQCGYCQPGQIMAAAALLTEEKDPSDDDIDAAMGGNICRCGTYTRIREAIKAAAKEV